MMGISFSIQKDRRLCSKKTKKRALLIFCLLCLLSVSLSATSAPISSISPDENGNIHVFLQDIIDSFENSVIQGTRIFMGSGSQDRFRYEYILRNGHNKIVSLKLPVELVWLRFNQETFSVQNGVKSKIDTPIKDLEDLLIEKIKTKTISFTAAEIGNAEIPSYFIVLDLPDKTQFRVVVLKENLQFSKIEYEKNGALSIMLYEQIFPCEAEYFFTEINDYLQLPSQAERTGNTTIATDTQQENGIEDLQNLIQEKNEGLSEFEPLVLNLVKTFVVSTLESVAFPEYSILSVTAEISPLTTVAILIIKSKQNGIPSSIPEEILQKIPAGYEVAKSIKFPFSIYVFGEVNTTVLNQICKQIISLIGN